MPKVFKVSLIGRRGNVLDVAAPSLGVIDSWGISKNGNSPSTVSLGAYANDFQQFRAATESAEGDYSVIAGGKGNNISTAGNYSFIGGGLSNSITDTHSVLVGGDDNDVLGSYAFMGGGRTNNINAAGDYSVIGGGLNNDVNSTHSVVAGGSDNDIGTTSNYSYIMGGIGCDIANNTLYAGVSGYYGRSTIRGQISQGGGLYASSGDLQTSVVCASAVAYKVTGSGTGTGTGPALLTTELLAAGSGNISIPSDTTWFFRVDVVGRRNDVDNTSGAWTFYGCIDNNAGTTALVGSVTKTLISKDDANWDVNITANNTSDKLQIDANNLDDQQVHWVARIELVQVTG